MLAPASPRMLATLAERAGPVDEIDGELGQPPLAGELARQHAGQQARVDVAAAQHEADLAALEAPGVLQHGGEARRAGALDDRLLDVDQQAHGVLDLRLATPARCRRPAGARSARVMRPGALTAMPSASVSPRMGRCAPLMALYMEG